MYEHFSGETDPGVIGNPVAQLPEVRIALSLDSLTARYSADEQTSQAARRVATALAAIGWRSASDAPAEEVAAGISLMIAACVRRHRDLALLRRNVARHLHQHAHTLDGSGAGVAAWEPAAAQVLERYAGTA
ncbi:MAG TPA: hypothetical protein VFT96_10190 [Gemmatimonadaceae bacterium]|nr:hypothetical protein [Gemmatimonadaceae bacterium]